MRSEWLTLLLCSGLLSAAPVARAVAGTSPKPVNGAIPHLEEEQAQAAGLTAREVKDASKLYTSKCMRCHKSYEVRAYAQPQWEAWMTKMTKKARLGSEKSELIRRYLDAYRANPTAVQTNSVSR